MALVHNAWYVAAWPHEISKDALLSRTVCNETMVLWRGPDGAVTALEDRCPHREMPLAMGFVDSGDVRCRYHGLRFGADGRCNDVPGQDNIPANLSVRRYPIIERYGYVWVWPGDAARASTLPVPDCYAHNDRPDLPMEGGVAHFDAGYQLFVDNLLDLTHLPYIHPSTLGNQAVFESPPETVVDGDRITVTRWILDHLPPPYWVEMLKHQTGYEGRCDRWQLTYYTPPSLVWLDVGVAPVGTGAPQGYRSRGVSQITNHAITPETETTSWDFWSVGSVAYGRARSREVADILGMTILQEDRVAVESVQTVMNRHPGRPYASIATDKPGLAARRIVERMLAAEAAAISKAG